MRSLRNQARATLTESQDIDIGAFRQPKAPSSAIAMIGDDIADVAALVRLAIVAIQGVEDMAGEPDPETLGSVVTSLFVADRMLCRTRGLCEGLGSLEVRR
jgi:hypothetical protein